MIEINSSIYYLISLPSLILKLYSFFFKQRWLVIDFIEYNSYSLFHTAKAKLFSIIYHKILSITLIKIARKSLSYRYALSDPYPILQLSPINLVKPKITLS